MNFVTKEEFEVVRKLAQDNRLMIEKLQKKKSTKKTKTIKSEKK